MAARRGATKDFIGHWVETDWNDRCLAAATARWQPQSGHDTRSRTSSQTKHWSHWEEVSLPIVSYLWRMHHSPATITGSLIRLRAWTDARWSAGVVPAWWRLHGCLFPDLAGFLRYSPGILLEYRTRLARLAGWGIFVSTLSFLSTKLTSIASGAAEVPFGPFITELLAERFARTICLAWLVRRHGGASGVCPWARLPTQ